MRRYLRPGLKRAYSHTSLHWLSSVRTVDSHYLVNDKLGLKCRLEAESCHVPNERFDACLH